jgi:hypothetical protein
MSLADLAVGMAKKYPARSMLTPAHYTQIGHVIVIWAYLEIEVDKLLARLLKLKKARRFKEATRLKKANLIPGKFKDRLKLLNVLAKIFYKEPQCHELSRIAKKCLDLYDDRNRLAHGDWAFVNKFDGKPGRLLSRTWKLGVLKDERVVTVDQIRNTRREIGLAVIQLVDFRFRNQPDGNVVRRLLGIMRHLANSQKRARRSATPKKPQQKHPPSQA